MKEDTDGWIRTDNKICIPASPNKKTGWQLASTHGRKFDFVFHLMVSFNDFNRWNNADEALLLNLSYVNAVRYIGMDIMYD
jgi:hypothetical protein